MNENRKMLLKTSGAGTVGLVLVGAVVVWAGGGPNATGTVGQDPRAVEGGDMPDAAMDGSIRLSTADAGTFGITFDLAEVRKLEKAIRATGFVELDETRMVYVAAKFGGWVEELHVNFVGQPVRAGQALLEVYSPELVSAQEELLLAARMVQTVGESRVEGVAGGARELLESARRRLTYWDVSEDQIEGIVESGEVRRTLTLHAPASGIVTDKDVFEGQAFQPGRNLYMIADLARVWVNAEIFEADIPFVHEGMPAEISMAARPGETLRGTIEYVYPTLSDRTRSMTARIAVQNPRGELKPGMYATARLTADLGEALTVPTPAVLHSGERAVAFVDMGGGRLMPHELRLGTQGEGYVQVLEGLESGQRVVTSAQFLLDSESNLAEVMQAMMAQMSLSDMGSMEMPETDTGGVEMPGGQGPEVPGAPGDTSTGGMNMPGMEE